MPFRVQKVNDLIDQAKQEDPEFQQFWEGHEQERFLRGELISLRQARGFTQQALADRCGVSQQLISRMENGENSPTLRTLCRVLDELNCHIEFVPNDKYHIQEQAVLSTSENLERQ